MEDVPVSLEFHESTNDEELGFPMKTALTNRKPGKEVLGIKRFGLRHLTQDIGRKNNQKLFCILEENPNAGEG